MKTQATQISTESIEKQERLSLNRTVILPGGKSLIITGVSLSLLGLFSLPSLGIVPLSLNNFILPSNFNFNSLWQSAQSQLLQSFSQVFGQVPNWGNVGLLRLPDPQSITQILEQMLGYEGWDESHNIDRVMTKILGADTLSTTGQWQEQYKTNTVQQKVNNSLLQANDAQSEVITQDVLKRIAAQNAKSAFLLGTLQEDLAKLNQGQDVSNRVLSNISATLVITEEFQPFTEVQESEESKPTKNTLAKNPLAKLGLIGGGLGIFFLILGLIFQGTTQLKSSVNAEQNQSEKAKKDTGPSGAETLAALKTEAALAGQEQQLANVKAKVDGATPKTQLVKSEPVGETPTIGQSVPTTTVPVSIPVSIPSRRVEIPRVVPKPSKLPIPVISRENQPSSSPTQPIDPMAQWQALAQLGSYSGLSEKTMRSGDRDTNEQLVASNPDSHVQTPHSPPLGLVGGGSLLTPHSSSQGIIPRTQSVVAQSTPNSRLKANATSLIEHQNTPPSVSSNQMSEEERFLAAGSKQKQQLRVGQTAVATLASSLVTESTNNQSQSDWVERGIVTLSSPLTNSSGEVVLPSGTPLVVVVQGVHDSGRVKAIIQSVIKQGTEYPVPNGAMVLQGSGGNPLMAKLIESGQNERMKANATTFMVGALSKTGELLNRGSTSTFISGGNYSQTQEFNEPNYLGGLLEGGFTPLAEQMNQQHEDRLSKLDSRSPLWVLEKGSTVEIFVNQSWEF